MAANGFSSPQTFSASEIWVLLQLLGAIAPHLSPPPEIAAGPEALSAAQAALIERGLLQELPGRAIRVSPGIAALLSPAIWPETVFVVSISDNARYGQLTHLACFGLTAEALTVNWRAEDDTHHFESHSPTDLKAAILAHLFRFGRWEFAEPESITPAEAAAAAESALEQLRQVGLIMAVTAPATETQTVQALAWFVSDRYAWLMRNSAPNTPADVLPVSRAGLALAVFDFIEQTLPESQTEELLPAASA